MQLTLWTYEGPPHVGAMRIATAMEGVHYVLHAPQGDTYADLLFTMIERRDRRPPVTYTTFQARDLGGDTAELFKTAVPRRLRALPAAGDAGRRLLHRRADPGRSRRPRAGAGPADPGDRRSSCRPTSGRRTGARPRPSTSWSGRWPAARRRAPARASRRRAALQHPRADRARLPPPRRRGRGHAGCSTGSASTSTSSAPLGATPADLARLGEADFNVVLYPEIAGTAAQLAGADLRPALRRRTVPIGVGGHPRLRRRGRGARRRRCRRPCSTDAGSRLPWYSRSVDFDLPDRQARLHLRRRHPRHRGRPRRRRGAGLHGGRASAPTAASSPARCARPPKRYGVEALITDDYLEVEASDRASCSPSWCSARRWSGTSPSGSASPAR